MYRNIIIIYYLLSFYIINSSYSISIVKSSNHSSDKEIENLQKIEQVMLNILSINTTEEFQKFLHENNTKFNDTSKSNQQYMVIPKIEKTQTTTTQSTSTSKQIADIKEEKLQWISEPFRKGFDNLVIESNVNEKCNHDVRLQKIHFKNHTSWAVRLFDSTQREPIGIIGGTNLQVGNFEECVVTSGYGINGQYCIAKFRYDLDPDIQVKYDKMVPSWDFNDVDHEESIWESMTRMRKDPVRVSRNDISWGICLPASCSAKDLERSLNKSLIPEFEQRNIKLKVQVDEINCSTKDWLPFTTGFWYTISFMFILAMIVVISTTYDFYEYLLTDNFKRETEGFREVVAAFSAFRNVYNLGIYSKESQIKMVNGYKFIMMVLIIYGHRLMYLLGYPQTHPEAIEAIFRRGADIALVNTNIVDTFLAISGFITFYYGFDPMKVGGAVFLVLSMVFRYLRLMPTFALIMAYTVNVLPYTSDGPIWKEKMMFESETCRENWWLNLLLVNNFFNQSRQCIIYSWYITTDMQLAIVGSIVMFIMVKNRKLGLSVMTALLVGTSAIAFLITYVNKYDGMLKTFMSVVEEPRRNIFYQKVYTALFTRTGPFMAGFLGAYIALRLKERNFQFSTKWMLIGTIIAIAVGEGSQYYGIVFYKFGRPYYPVENALYAATHRVVFGGMSAWLMMMYATSGFGIFTKTVNHRFFTVFGRMTYSVFLVNTIALMTLNASIRVPFYASYKFIWWIVMGDVVVIYILGFLLYVYAEAPSAVLSKILQKKLVSLFSREIEEAKKAAAAKENGTKKKIEP